MISIPCRALYSCADVLRIRRGCRCPVESRSGGTDPRTGNHRWLCRIWNMILKAVLIWSRVKYFRVCRSEVFSISWRGLRRSQLNMRSRMGSYSMLFLFFSMAMVYFFWPGGAVSMTKCPFLHKYGTVFIRKSILDLILYISRISQFLADFDCGNFF